MGDEERHVGTLKATVEAIYAGIKATELAVSQEFGLTPFLPEQNPFCSQPGAAEPLSGA